MKRRRIGYGIYMVLILGICLIPLLMAGRGQSVRTAENRTPAPWPELLSDGSFNWEYLQEAGAYFTDHFGFRQELVAADAWLRSSLFEVSPVESVIVGKNGWLYYEATLDDFQHNNGVSERMLFNMAHNVALMQEYTQMLGKTFIFTVAPNKNSLYSENMPDRLKYRFADESDMQRLKPWLEREGVNYVDLFSLFLIQNQVLYYARDSHWNQRGAVMVCNMLLEACGKPRGDWEESGYEVTKDYYGDLNRMLFPVGGRPEEEFRYKKDFTWSYSLGESVEDNFIQTTCENGEQNLLLYRDSFGNSMLPYLAEAFSEATFSKQVPYPMTDLVTCSPDVVILEKVERHLPTLGQVPPLMSGLQRTLDAEPVPVESTATCTLTKEGSYWRLEGLADGTYMDTDSRIWLEVEDGEESRVFEAFCMGSSGESDDADYGYLLYLSEIMLHGDSLQIRVMTEKEGEILLLHEEKIGI